MELNDHFAFPGGRYIAVHDVLLRFVPLRVIAFRDGHGAVYSVDNTQNVPLVTAAVKLFIRLVLQVGCGGWI